MHENEVGFGVTAHPRELREFLLYDGDPMRFAPCKLVLICHDKPPV
jgi:hypothetical protein